MPSLAFSLSKEDLLSIVKGALVAGSGAALIYAVQMIGALNFGIWTPAAGALSSILVNILRKWVEGATK